MSDAKKIIEYLDLQPHPEGGYYREMYRAEDLIESSFLPKRYSSSHSISTSIYFLLEGNDKSHFHRLRSDEIWHFYSGSTILLHQIDETGIHSVSRLGNKFDNNENPQIVIKHGNWFAAEVEDKDSYSLIGCTVAPGFDFNDFELAEQNELIIKFSEHTELIKMFTRI